MKKIFFKVLTYFFLAVISFSFLGCAVGFYKRHPKDIEKIDMLSKQLEELRRTKSQLEAQLEKEIEEGQVQVQMQDRGLVVTVVDEVLFDSGKAKIKEQGEAVLGKVAYVLSKIEKDIVIEGHTDDVPIKYSGWKSNWELSAHRALEVLHYFVDKKGLDPRRFSASGYGSYRPITSNLTEESRQKNRRVEIIILSQELKKKEIASEDESDRGVEDYIK